MAAWRGRILCVALLHINILLSVCGGALLAGGARLGWDPTVYVPLREIWPREYAVVTVVVSVYGAVLLVLAHVATTAVTTSGWRRALLLTYVCGTVLTVACITGLASWAVVQLRTWWTAEGAAAVRHGARVVDRLDALLQTLAEGTGGVATAATRLLELEREARASVMRLGRTWATAAGVLMALQLTALTLAVAVLIVERPCVRAASPTQPLLLPRGHVKRSFL